MTLRELAEAISAKERWGLQGGDGRFTMVVPIEGGRAQSVVLTEFAHDGSPMGRFTTRVGRVADLTPTRSRSALALNAGFPTGCLAIEGDELVMTDTRPLKTTTVESSAHVVRFLAYQADRYERQIYGTDTH